MKVDIPDRSPAVLADRIKKGTEIFQTLLDKVEICEDSEYEGLIGKLENTASRIEILRQVLSEVKE